MLVFAKWIRFLFPITNFYSATLRILALVWTGSVDQRNSIFRRKEKKKAIVTGNRTNNSSNDERCLGYFIWRDRNERQDVFRLKLTSFFLSNLVIGAVGVIVGASRWCYLLSSFLMTWKIYITVKQRTHDLQLTRLFGLNLFALFLFSPEWPTACLKFVGGFPGPLNCFSQHA